MPRGGADPLADQYRAALTEARDRTLSLVEDVSEHDLSRQHARLMSPLVWDLGHIAAFEDLWLCQRAGGLHPLRPDLAGVYDAAETPRTVRGDVRHLAQREVRDFLRDVRVRAMEVLDRADLHGEGDDLRSGVFAWEMVVQHEHQHNETMLQTLTLAAPGVYSPTRPERAPAPAGGSREMVRVDAGPFEMGDPGEGFAYDNERPRHSVDVAAFEIDATPVTNGDFEAFVADGGYERDELWSVDGLRWRFSESIQRPLYWTATGGERRFDATEERDPALPVMHVSWFEADAFARWRGARLPTEAEWEKAAAHDPATGESRHRPWGDGEATPERANLDQLAFGPAPVGSLPAGASAHGAVGMIGDCWEWTASPFGGYPGFEPFPYRAYSEALFGDGHRVLRGGSWATRPSVARSTFRNWDLPERRQIFAGFRCARDAS
jgi:iron(II)-dependent oxidoreductase